MVKDDFPEFNDILLFLKIVIGNETTYPTKEELVAGQNLRDIFKQRMIEDLQKSPLNEEQVGKLVILREFVAQDYSTSWLGGDGKRPEKMVVLVPFRIILYCLGGE